MAPAEVEQCDSAVVLNRVSVAGVDSAPAPDGKEAKDQARVEAEILMPAVGRIRGSMGQTEVRGQVAVRALDGVEVKDLVVPALAGPVASSVPTDVRMQPRPQRSSRNRSCRQKRLRVQRNLSRTKKILLSKKVSNRQGAYAKSIGIGPKTPNITAVELPPKGGCARPTAQA